jgi:hypothetical protein
MLYLVMKKKLNRLRPTTVVARPDRSVQKPGRAASRGHRAFLDAMNTQLVFLAEGMARVEPTLARLKEMAEAHRNGAAPPTFTDQEYMRAFTTIVNMTTQRAPHNYSQQLYDWVRHFTGAYVDRVVSPALQRAMDSGDFLTTLDAEWKPFSHFAKWTKAFFSYLDRFHTPRQNLPSVRMAVMLEFEQAALSTALRGGNMARSYAALALVYMRSKCTARDMCDFPLFNLDASLYTLAGCNGPAWARHVSGEDAMENLVASARTIGQMLPTEPRGNPYVGWALRQFLIDQITNFAFLRRMDDVVPQLTMDDGVTAVFNKVRNVIGLGPRVTAEDIIVNNTSTAVAATSAVASLGMAMARSRIECAGLARDGLALERYVLLPFPSDAVEMRSSGYKAASYRPFQLMLLGTLVSRGADSNKPLVFSQLELCTDLCDTIRRYMHTVPTCIHLEETFAWHVPHKDARAKRSRVE